MKLFLLAIALLIAPGILAQNNFDGFRYVIIPKQIFKFDSKEYLDVFGLAESTSEAFANAGMQVITPQEFTNINNQCEVLKVELLIPSFRSYEITLKAYDCNQKLIYSDVANASALLSIANAFNRDKSKSINQKDSYQMSLIGILQRLRKPLKGYRYQRDITPEIEIETIQSPPFDINDINAVKDYLDNTTISHVEGIWETTVGEQQYKILILKSQDKACAGYILDSNNWWKPGELKFHLRQTANPQNFIVDPWIMYNKRDEKKGKAQLSQGLLQISLNGSLSMELFKTYPIKLTTSIPDVIDPNDKGWTGNGSGLIISKEGHIVTNYHVIEDAEQIEVELTQNGKIIKVAVDILQTDQANDLAIIKVNDTLFKDLKDIPYYFKSRTADVGTKVYAYGYPMALSQMGKEIKITDGIISSKTGWRGDITKYQISAPIQGGNSGGPLFDDKGNFIGINSSGLRKDITDNVAYSIKSSYVLSLIDVLPKGIDLPSSNKLQLLPLTEQIKEISKYVVLVKIK